MPEDVEPLTSPPDEPEGDDQEVEEPVRPDIDDDDQGETVDA